MKRNWRNDATWENEWGNQYSTRAEENQFSPWAPSEPMGAPEYQCDAQPSHEGEYTQAYTQAAVDSSQIPVPVTEWEDPMQAATLQQGPVTNAELQICMCLTEGMVPLTLLETFRGCFPKMSVRPIEVVEAGATAHEHTRFSITGRLTDIRAMERRDSPLVNWQVLCYSTSPLGIPLTQGRQVGHFSHELARRFCNGVIPEVLVFMQHLIGREMTSGEIWAEKHIALFRDLATRTITATPNTFLVPEKFWKPPNIAEPGPIVFVWNPIALMAQSDFLVHTTRIWYEYSLSIVVEDRLALTPILGDVNSKDTLCHKVNRVLGRLQAICKLFDAAAVENLLEYEAWESPQSQALQLKIGQEEFSQVLLMAVEYVMTQRRELVERGTYFRRLEELSDGSIFDKPVESYSLNVLQEEWFRQQSNGNRRFVDTSTRHDTENLETIRAFISEIEILYRSYPLTELMRNGEYQCVRPTRVYERYKTWPILVDRTEEKAFFFDAQCYRSRFVAVDPLIVQDMTTKQLEFKDGTNRVLHRLYDLELLITGVLCVRQARESKAPVVHSLPGDVNVAEQVQTNAPTASLDEVLTEQVTSRVHMIEGIAVLSHLREEEMLLSRSEDGASSSGSFVIETVYDSESVMEKELNFQSSESFPIAEESMWRGKAIRGDIHHAKDSRKPLPVNGVDFWVREQLEMSKVDYKKLVGDTPPDLAKYALNNPTGVLSGLYGISVKSPNAPSGVIRKERVILAVVYRPESKSSILCMKSSEMHWNLFQDRFNRLFDMSEKYSVLGGGAQKHEFYDEYFHHPGGAEIMATMLSLGHPRGKLRKSSVPMWVSEARLSRFDPTSVGGNPRARGNLITRKEFDSLAESRRQGWSLKLESVEEIVTDEVATGPPVRDAPSAPAPTTGTNTEVVSSSSLAPTVVPPDGLNTSKDSSEPMQVDPSGKDSQSSNASTMQDVPTGQDSQSQIPLPMSVEELQRTISALLTSADDLQKNKREGKLTDLQKNTLDYLEKMEESMSGSSTSFIQIFEGDGTKQYDPIALEILRRRATQTSQELRLKYGITSGRDVSEPFWEVDTETSGGLSSTYNV